MKFGIKNILEFFNKTIIYSSYQAFYIFIIFLISNLFINKYYDFVIYFIYIFCGIIFSFGLLYSIKYNYYQSYNNLESDEAKIFKINKIQDYSNLLIVNNLIVHIIPLLILLLTIKVNFNKIIKTKYGNIFTIILLLSLFIINNTLNSSFHAYNKIWGLTSKEYIQSNIYIIILSIFLLNIKKFII